MIKPINNISLIVPGGSNLTTSQKKVAIGITKELDDMKLEKDRHFLIKPLENDVVELSEIIKVKNVTNDTVDWNDRDLLYIGEYSEKQPFKSKDYLKAIAEPYKDLLRLIGITVTAALLFLMGAGLALREKRENSTQQVEKVITMAKDSLKK